MGHYRLNTYHYRHVHKFFSRIKKLSIFLLSMVLVATTVILIDSALQEKQSTIPTDTTAETRTSILPSDQIFRTAYFQIQAPKSWVAIPDDSTASKFVYRSLDKTLVQQQIE